MLSGIGTYNVEDSVVNPRRGARICVVNVLDFLKTNPTGARILDLDGSVLLLFQW